MINNINSREIIQGTNTKTEISKKRKISDEDQYRVVISKEINESLESLVKKINNGFDGGEITKSDVANFLILGSAKSFSDAEIKILRGLHFDEKKMLRSILRQTGDEGDLPEHLKKALREHYGLAESRERRTSRKASQEESKPLLSTSSSTDNHDFRSTSN